MNKAWLNFAVFLVVCVGITGFVGFLVGCTPTPTSPNYRQASSKDAQAIMGINGGALYKVKVDTNEYLIFISGSSSAAITKHK